MSMQFVIFAIVLGYPDSVGLDIQASSRMHDSTDIIEMVVDENGNPVFSRGTLKEYSGSFELELVSEDRRWLEESGELAEQVDPSDGVSTLDVASDDKDFPSTNYSYMDATQRDHARAQAVVADMEKPERQTNGNGESKAGVKFTITPWKNTGTGSDNFFEKRTHDRTVAPEVPVEFIGFGESVSIWSDLRAFMQRYFLGITVPNVDTNKVRVSGELLRGVQSLTGLSQRRLSLVKLFSAVLVSFSLYALVVERLQQSQKAKFQKK